MAMTENLPHASAGYYRLLTFGLPQWLDRGPFDCVACAQDALREWVADGGNLDRFHVRLAGPFPSAADAEAADISDTPPAVERDFLVGVGVGARHQTVAVVAYDAGDACLRAAHIVHGDPGRGASVGVPNWDRTQWTITLGHQSLGCAARPASRREVAR